MGGVNSPPVCNGGVIGLWHPEFQKYVRLTYDLGNYNGKLIKKPRADFRGAPLQHPCSASNAPCSY